MHCARLNVPHAGREGDTDGLLPIYVTLEAAHARRNEQRLPGQLLDEAALLALGHEEEDAVRRGQRDERDDERGEEGRAQHFSSQAARRSLRAYDREPSTCVYRHRSTTSWVRQA